MYNMLDLKCLDLKRVSIDYILSKWLKRDLRK